MNSPPQPPDPERFRDLYDANYESVLRFVQRRLQEPDRTEDVVHEAFLVAWRRRDSVPLVAEDARAWLFGVARNCLLAEGKARSRRVALSVRLALEAPATAPDHGLDVLQRADFARAWDKLQPAEQEALSLALWDDLSSVDAAHILGISPGAYRVRLTRARTSLRTHLDTSSSAATARPYLRTNS